jgi:hypothetical protein
MAKVIPLNINQAYAKSIEQTIGTLEQMESEIHFQIIALAISGKWKKWSDDQPIGTEFIFKEEMLRDTGDKNVDLLCELMDKIVEVRKKMM